MFGLSFEKLFLVAIIAGLVIASLPEDDPRRLAAHVPPPAAEDETELLLAEVEQLLENPVRS